MGTGPVPHGAAAGPAKSERRQSALGVRAARFLSIGLLLILALGPGSADAVTLVPIEGAPTHRYQEWAKRAKVPTVDAPIRFYTRSDPSCPGGHTSCAGTYPLHIFLGDQDRWTFYHELGHIFDYVVMGAGADASTLTWWRQQFLAIRGRSGGWREGDNRPNEQFAQAYMFCAMDPRELPRGSRKRFMWDYGYAGTSERQHRRSCRLIYRAWQAEGG
jgi:hypothetical protein